MRDDLENFLHRLREDDLLLRPEGIGRRLLLARALAYCGDGPAPELVIEDAAIDLETAGLKGREEVAKELLALLLNQGFKDKR